MEKLTLESTVIPSGVLWTCPFTPQNHFRPGRLVIPDSIASRCVVEQITVGTQNQFVPGAPIPGSVFSESSTVRGIAFDITEFGNYISMQVRNKSDADLEFSAEMFAGKAERPRRYLLGLEEVTIGAGDTKKISAPPQNLFKIIRAIVPSEITGMSVLDIFIGARGQFATEAAIPVEAFSEKAVDTVEVLFETAGIGDSVEWVVRNDSTEPKKFSAAMVGTLSY